MNKENLDVRDVLEDLKIKPELLGLTAINQFSIYNSSPRGVMLLSQMSQIVMMTNGDERIVQSGIESEMVKTLFDKKIKNESKILAVVPKYKGNTIDDVDALVDVTVIYHDLVDNKIDFLVIPKFEKNHNYLGFEYNWSSTLNNLEYEEIVPGGTILAQSKSVSENGGYKFGVNLNTCMVSMPEVGEDAVVISESTRDKLKFKIWETRRISFGGDVIPLNLYGDDDNYKIMPDIGEYLHDSGVLMATRNFNEMLAPSLFSNKSLRNINEHFDNCVYVRGNKGKVVNIEVIHTPKTQKDIHFNQTEDQVRRYARGLDKYYSEIIQSCDDASARYGDDLMFSDRLHRHLVDIKAMRDPSVMNMYRKDRLNTFNIVITICYEDMRPGLQYKISDLSGSLFNRK